MDSGTPVICEVCGTYFETRRGLSSHARLHLRQLGVSMSESSGAPIELLYKIIEEKDVSLSNLESASPAPVQILPQKAAKKESTMLPVTKGSSSKAWSKVMTVSQKTASRVSPPGFKEYAASLFSPQRGADIKISDRSNSTSVGPAEPVTKPLWAPQETDAPLTLASNSKDEAHVCQLCGAWYETRKGLSSHARAHLRQIGVTESGDGKSPIELLYEIIKAEDLKPGTSTQQEPFNLHSPVKSTTKRPSALSTTPTFKGSPSSEFLLAPPSKRARTSEEYTCILCGEEFENRKGLGSHSRSHLRQIGVSHLLEKGSAIETVQELVSSGVLAGIRPLETNNTASSISAPSPSSALSLSPTFYPTTARSTQSPPSSASRAPKAKKGFRLAVDPLSRKPKHEAGEMFFPISPERYSNSSSPGQKLSSPAVLAERSHTAIPVVQCEVCSQLFDSRKALSCHVRAHLRQLGISWSVNESPIDLLRDVMVEVKKESASSGRSASGLPMWFPQGPKRSLDRHMLQDPPNKHYNSPLDFSLKEKLTPGKSGSTQAVSVASCELCGFDFDNRKALASHARAHLRQLGATEWKADGTKGSPIELLSAFIQKEPAKVAEITRRYQTGDLFIKKTQKSALSPAPSTDSDYVSWNPLGRQSVQRVYLFNGDSSKATQERPHAARSHMQARAACTDLSVRSSTGFWPQKSSMTTEEENSQQPSRSGNIPALLPRPPRTPLVKLVGKVYSLKCRFCEEVFQGPLSVQGDWIRHLQKHILSLGYRGKASPLPTPAAAPALVGPVAV